MNIEQHAQEIARQWLSLTPEQRMEIRRQNLRVQAIIDKYQRAPGTAANKGE